MGERVTRERRGAGNPIMPSASRKSLIHCDASSLAEIGRDIITRGPGLMQHHQISGVIGGFNYSLRMHRLQEPIRWNFSADPFGFRFRVDRAADGGKLDAEADVVDKASYLVGGFTSRNITTHNVF